MGLTFKPDLDDISQRFDILAVEPNISIHKEFKNLDIKTKLDFCGVIK